MPLDLSFWNRFSVRVRLILLFIAIKVMPLLLLLWIAWQQTQTTANHVGEQIGNLTDTASEAISEVGEMAVGDVVEALDNRAREEIERLATDTARRVAEFLYSRDSDARYAATLRPDAATYRDFVEHKRRDLVAHGPWRLNEAKTDWEPESTEADDHSDMVAEDVDGDGVIDYHYRPDATPGSHDNANQFHYRPPKRLNAENKPLYLEMTFVGLDGMEKLKVTTSPRMDPALKDVSQRANTYARAESYFPALQSLKPGEIYVSDVIGAYVGSRIIGKFTPEAAEKRGIAFEPEKSAYAGKENPVGKRFEGIVRWATPVVKEGRVAGWVTLALNHDHLMSFTDTIVPTDERYRDINDASDGNYAFMWDYKGRSMVHPRHHSIVGYDAEGEPHIPWLEDVVYEDFVKSGKKWGEYLETAPTFVDQLQSRKAAKELTENGSVGLDCRWLNFAPQCVGWYNVADSGGSGSFLILWSGLWKLTTVATIPYYTGQYSPEATGNKRGFGIVTIGANVDDFHSIFANMAKEQLDSAIKDASVSIVSHGEIVDRVMRDYTMDTAYRLAFATVLLAIAVIAVAVWLAGILSKKVAWLNEGFNRFRFGDRGFRFRFAYHDEITSLAATFNDMANTLNTNMEDLRREVEVRREKEQELRDMHNTLELRISERTAELSREVEIRREAEVRLQHLAHHDPLTDLANRSLFNEQLARALSQSKRSGRYGALLFLDLDKFKHINDTLGHAVGDALLIHMANVLRERIRSGTDTAARLGGDEFAVIMVDMERAESAAVLAQEILNKLDVPVTLEGHELKIRSSIGIVTFPSQEQSASQQDADNIIKSADTAMYLAKSTGGMRYCFFEKSLHERIVENDRFIGELRVALAERQFIPYFQPIYHTDAKEALYLEVLVRWQHPTGPVLSAESFIGPATQSGLLEKIDLQMLDVACGHARLWREAGLEFGRISVNVSQWQFDHPRIMGEIESILERHKLPPVCLAFEIPEFVLMKNSAQSGRVIKELREKGVHIIIDKLQTERAALSNLLEYAVDGIKIRHTITSRIGDPKIDALIATIASVANAVHLRLIAGGVETEQQWRFFEKLNCEIIQGFYHSPPMNAEDTQRYLEAQKAANQG